MDPSQQNRVTVWNENRHEKQNPAVASIYPQGIHGAIAGCLNSQAGISAGVATLDESEHGLHDSVLNTTDVLLWWGHLAHHDVKDEIAEKVYLRVLAGMGLIVLHSANSAKPFRKLMGTSCTARWREAGEKHRLWVVAPAYYRISSRSRTARPTDNRVRQKQSADLATQCCLGCWCCLLPRNDAARSGACIVSASGKRG